MMHTPALNLTPRGRILDFSADGWTVWDGSPIWGPDGQVHVFATRWRATDRPDANWFQNGSQIFHAVADQPEGPYEIRDIAIEGQGGDARWDDTAVINAKICQVGERYALLYTGCRARRHDTQAIGMLTASSLDGPWTRVSDETPLIAPEPDRGGFDGYLCNNPALLQHPNGQFWIYYKGRDVAGGADGGYLPGGMVIGLAVADSLEGPYTKHPAGPVLDLSPKEIEDPYAWHADGTFWLIASELGGDDPVLERNAGLLFRSNDGLHWSDPVLAYPSPRSLWGREQRLEEPNLLFRDGKPTHLFNILGACPEDPVYSTFVSEIG